MLTWILVLLIVGTIGVVALGLLDAKRTREKQSAADQIAYLRRTVQLDHRWMGHDTTADALTARYLELTEPDWYTRPVEDVSAFRDRICLTPDSKPR